MSAMRGVLVLVVASAALLAVGIGPRAGDTARARAVAVEGSSAGTTIPYAGYLADATGQPVADGAYDLSFALYDAAVGGAPLWSEVQEAVVTRGGTFAVTLGNVNVISPAVLNGAARWLAVAVRGPGEAEFTALDPRQRLAANGEAAAAASSAGVACPHDHFGASWSGSVPWSSSGFKVTNYSTGPAVWGQNTGGGNGVRGDGYGTSIGVYGEGENGPGVAGRSATGPAIRADGDLYVTGAFRGNIGPGGGAPFPRPAYDSGWRPIAKGGTVTLDHNLGGNADDYVVHLEFKDINGAVHNYLYGGMTWSNYLGAWWEDLTSQHIKVQRMPDDEWVYQVRVRIWVYR